MKRLLNDLIVDDFRKEFEFTLKEGGALVRTKAMGEAEAKAHIEDCLNQEVKPLRRAA